jgi:hypothetical protein
MPVSRIEYADGLDAIAIPVARDREAPWGAEGEAARLVRRDANEKRGRRFVIDPDSVARSIDLCGRWRGRATRKAESDSRRRETQEQ